MLNQLDLLFTEPVVFWFSGWISFSWALIFLFFESVPPIFRTSYGFSPPQTGLAFISMCVGAILGNIFYRFQEIYINDMVINCPTSPSQKSILGTTYVRGC